MKLLCCSAEDVGNEDSVREFGKKIARPKLRSVCVCVCVCV